MTTVLATEQCVRCRRRRPQAYWPFGLQAEVAGQGGEWLCEACEAVPGAAWSFIDAIRAIWPDAAFFAAEVYGDVIVRFPLVIPHSAHAEVLATVLVR